MGVLNQMIQEAGGSVSFERFMQAALYDPAVGYYTSHIREVGRRGDFSTSVTIASLLGQSIARWLVENKGGVQSALRWHVIEVGGGNGDLALSILGSLPFLDRLTVQYHLVEISPGLRLRQQSLLAGKPVVWHSEMESALKAARGRALIVSNELVDAFPCVVVRRRGDVFEQLRLIFSDGAVAEGWTGELDARLLRASSSVFAQPSGIQNGQRCEIHLSYREWLESWQSLWQCGHMLTVDYGDVYPDLYYRRPDGTVRGYFFHQRIEGMELYHRFGKQDLTADVNFTDLQTWGSEFGYVNHPLVTQRDFIFKYAPRSSLEVVSAGRDCLIAIEGAGSAYKVLWQSR